MKNKPSRFDDFFNKYGFILDLKYFYKILDDPEKLKDFLNQITIFRKEGLQSEVAESQYVKNVLGKYFNDIDQEAYIFYTLKTIKEHNMELKYSKVFQRCIDYLKDSKYTHYEAGKTDDGKDVEIKRITARSLIGREENIDETKLKERWDRITEKVDPLSFFSLDSNTEIEKFYCKDPDLASYIVKLSFVNMINKFQEMSMDEKLDYLGGNAQEKLEQMTRGLFDKIDLNSEKEISGFYSSIPEYIGRYPKEFDIDRLMLIAAFRVNDHLENTEMSREKNMEYASFLKICKEEIRKNTTPVVGIRDASRKRTTIPYSYKSLLKACERISPNGYYLSEAEMEKIAEEIFKNPSDSENLLMKDPDKLVPMKLTDEELEYLLEGEGAIGFLAGNQLLPKRILIKAIDNGKIAQKDFRDLLNKNLLTENEVKKYISKLDVVEEETFELLNDKELINAEDKLGLFLADKVSYELIDGLQEEEKKEIAGELSIERLVELFRDRDKGDSDEYIRYVQLFRNLVLKDMSKEERQKLDEQIIEQFDLEIEEKDFEELYKTHLISFQTLKEWTGPQVVSEMMSKTQIRPEDVKEMCSDGEFNTLYAVLENSDISKSVKMAIFRTSFANIDYDSMTEEKQGMLKEARDKCLKLINFDDFKTARNNQGDGTRKRKGEGKRFNEYTSDPQLRWDLVDLMGEYSYEMLDQGLAIFKFPEYKGGTIVLEKMYKKDKPEYGRATKIINMSIEEFERIKKDLIVDDDIPPFMIDSHPALQGKITSLAHSTAWGQQFADYFEYDIENQRTQEEIDKIDKKIKSILDSRELR